MNKPIACGSHEWEMTMHEFRRMAAAMDLRIQQLTAEGVHGLAVIERTVGHLPDLHRIWIGTSDHQLATLCNDLPGFSRSASFMEEAADVPKKTVDIFVDAFDPMAKRIAQMQNRAMTGD
jgi:hypothetical protein